MWDTRSLKRTGLAAGLILAAATAFAVHDAGVFELDGNAVEGAAAGDDWRQIYCDHVDLDRNGICTGVPASSANLLVGKFLTDPVESPSDDIFDGAKDTMNIVCTADDPAACSDWQWKVAEPNDKNDIEHGYAAMYNTAVDGSGDFILYFGMDKLDNSGDAALGFWFLQNDVTQEGTEASGNPFSDGHEPGDVLVQSDFTNGGDLERLDAYVWVAGDSQSEIETACENLGGEAVAPAQGGLCRIESGVDCDLAGADDDLCSQVNDGDQAAPWPYIFKGPGGVAASAVFPDATFFEAGLNLSALFPGGIPCFSSFLAETRQSQSETAELEDKLLGSFDLCSLDVTKSGPEKSKIGDTATYTIVITNNGALPLTKVSIVDNKLGTLTGDAGCGATLNPGASCTITVEQVIPANAPDPLVNTVTATYIRDTATVDTTVTETASHTVDLFQPSITFDKKAEGSDGPLNVLQGATVDYDLTLNNTSSSDTPNLVCTITDDKLAIDPNNTDGDGNAGTIEVTLTSGNSVTVSASHQFLTTETPYTNTASVSCSPDGFPNVLTASDAVTVNVIPSDQALSVSKTGPDYAKVGDSVTYTIRIDNIGGIEVTLTAISDTLMGNLLATAEAACGDLVLAAGDYCEFTVNRTVLAGDPDPVLNEVSVTGEGEFGGQAGPVTDDHSVDLVHPSYTVTKDCLTDPVPQGQSANFRITIVNTGDTDLVIDVTDTVLSIADTDLVLGERGGAACTVTDLDSDPSDGCYQIEAGVTATGSEVSNTVEVHATLPEALALTNEIDHSAGDTCPVTTEGTTRTWGFWKTHGSDGDQFDEPVEYGYTCHVFEDHLGSSVYLGWKTLSSCPQVFGLFWADPAKDGSEKRNATCKTALHASQQLLSAILNEALDNGATLNPTLKADAIAALAACADNNSATACNRNLLTNLAGQLAAYNESGDDVAIVDGDGAFIPHADPRGTRDEADYDIGSCPAP